MKEATIYGLEQLDTAVLLEKMIVLNGMLLYGRKEEKERALSVLPEMERILLRSVNVSAWQEAAHNLQLTSEMITRMHRQMTQKMNKKGD